MRVIYSKWALPALQEGDPAADPLEPPDPIDDIEGPEDMDNQGIRGIEEAERNMLDEMLLPNVPENEAQRRREGARLPRKTRVAASKLHHQFGHLPRRTMKEILKQAKSPPELTAAVDKF